MKTRCYAATSSIAGAELAGVDEGIAALQELKRMNVLAPSLADGLIADATMVRQAIEERIADLRSRVWWA